MMKKLFLGLLICVATLAFTACSNDSKENDSAPVIEDAIFIQGPEDDIYGKTFEYLESHYKITSLGLNDTDPYYLLAIIKDDDRDINNVEINLNSNFSSSTGWYWEDNAEDMEDYYDETNSVVWLFVCGFRTSLNDTQKSAFTMNNGTIYVRVTDKKGNANTYQITGISVTLNNSSN